MRKELILFLSCSIMLTAMISEVNSKDTNTVQNNATQAAFPFDDDSFFQSNANVFDQIKTMQQAMDRLIEQHFTQINNNQLNLKSLKHLPNSPQEIQMEERNNELIYKIKQPQGNDSKVDISVKDGVLIITTQLIQKTTHNDHGSKRYSYSQSNYNQSFQLPKGYDPTSIDIKSKDVDLIVTFKKEHVSKLLTI